MDDLKALRRAIDDLSALVDGCHGDENGICSDCLERKDAAARLTSIIERNEKDAELWANGYKPDGSETRHRMERDHYRKCYHQASDEAARLRQEVERNEKELNAAIEARESQAQAIHELIEHCDKLLDRAGVPRHEGIGILTWWYRVERACQIIEGVQKVMSDMEDHADNYIQYAADWRSDVYGWVETLRALTERAKEPT
jgi:hypothetical protein